MNYIPCKRCGYYHDDGTADYCVPCIFVLGNVKEQQKKLIPKVKEQAERSDTE